MTQTSLTNSCAYPAEMMHDIQTLVFECQPSSILIIGNASYQFLDSYREQSSLLNRPIRIDQIRASELPTLGNSNTQYDLGIVFDCLEHIDKQDAFQLLAKMRDLHTRQYCLGVSLANHADSMSSRNWSLTELYSLALKQVSTYQQEQHQYGLFKYKVQTYKNTPRWLNSDNWANPENWGKYRW